MLGHYFFILYCFYVERLGLSFRIILRPFQEEPSRNVLVSLVVYSTKSVVDVVFVLNIHSIPIFGPL